MAVAYDAAGQLLTSTRYSYIEEVRIAGREWLKNVVSKRIGSMMGEGFLPAKT